MHKQPIDDKNISIYSSFLRIWPFLKPYKGRLFGSLILVTLQVIANVLEPFIFGLMITEITANVVDMIRGVDGAGLNYSYLYTMLIIYFIRGVIGQISTYGSTYFMTEAVQNMTFNLRGLISNKLNRLPVSYFDQHQFGNILNRITNDIDTDRKSVV